MMGLSQVVCRPGAESHGMALVALLEGNKEVELPGLPPAIPSVDYYLVLNNSEDKRFQVHSSFVVA